MTATNWSVPTSDLMAAMGEALDTNRRAVIATIVHVEGSAYRRPGAKMLIPEGGGGIGSVTAGCLENELLDLADSVLNDGGPRVETFDLTGDDDVWGLGVGCNGVIDVLLEPLNDEYRAVVEAFDSGDPVALVTVFDGDDAITAREVYKPEGDAMVGDGDVPEPVVDRIQPALEVAIERGKAETLSVSDQRVFVDGITPPPRLLLLGHGHDIGPVVDLGKKNDFRVEVAAFRGASKAAERFPQADAIHTTSPAKLAEDVPLDDDTYVVAMTHNFIDDRLALEVLLDEPVAYVGLLGPRERFEEILDAFEDDGVELEPSALDLIYTPIGIDLGGGTPYQIAHSIVAEVLAVHNGRNVKHLREREGPIHDRLSIDGEPQ